MTVMTSNHRPSMQPRVVHKQIISNIDCDQVSQSCASATKNCLFLLLNPTVPNVRHIFKGKYMYQLQVILPKTTKIIKATTLTILTYYMHLHPSSTLHPHCISTYLPCYVCHVIRNNFFSVALEQVTDKKGGGQKKWVNGDKLMQICNIVLAWTAPQ